MTGLAVLTPPDSGTAGDPTPATGRCPTGELIPVAWRGIGQRGRGPGRQRPVPGRVYGRSRRRRMLARVGRACIVLVLAAAALVVLVAFFLLRLLVL